MKHILPLFFLSAAVIAAPQIAPTTFPTKDVPIVDRIFNPPPPDQDASPALQAVIDELAKAGGGTIFIPAGHVRIEAPIILKEGVVLRGDFLPFQQDRRLGTVFDIVCGKNEPDGKPAFGVERGTGLRELAFWYPEQNASAPVPYPWTVYATAKNCGNNFTIFNCVFLNPWKAIHIGPEWNELHTIRNTQIFPFETGLFMDFTTDIGRLDGLHILSPEYAAKIYPSLPNLANPKLDGINSVGIDIGRSDWEYIRNINVAGMKIGVRFRKGSKGATNAVIAYSTIAACETALELNELDGIGVSLYSCTLAGTKQAVLTTPLFETVAQFNRCRLIDMDSEAIVRANGSGILTFDACDFAGKNVVAAEAGRLQFANCDISSVEPSTIELGEKVRMAHLLGGSLAQKANIKNNAMNIDYIQSDIDATYLPPREYKLRNVTTRDFRYFKSENLVLATAYGASPTIDDNGSAFQKALDAAAEMGGATVYAPAGLYRFQTNITVPSNVELRGCFSVPHHTVSGGTVLMPLQGRGDENGTPFVSLQPKSGLNGLSFWYPEQSTAEPVPYPWTVRSLGADCWLVNTNIGNAWQGVDFLTNPSDNHYVNYLSGGMMRRGLQVGNSNHGTVIDVQFNPHYTHRLPSYLPHQKLPDFFAFIDYQRANLDAIVVQDALNETMIGNFLYAARDGLRFQGKCTGDILMHGADTVWNPVALECDTVDNRVTLKDCELRFALAQLVPMGKGVVGGIVTRPSFRGKATFANSQLWGTPVNGQPWTAPATAKLDGNGTVILDQFNTLTGPVFINNGDCHLIATYFTNPTLTPHISIAKEARRVRALAASTPGNSVTAEYPQGADVKMVANSQPVLPPIPKDAVVPNWRADFESESNPPVVQDTVALTGGGIKQVSDYSCRVVERDDAHSGSHALRLQGNSDDPSYSYIYCEIFRGPFTVMPDTVFRYWIKLLNEKSFPTGLDIHFTNGKVMRDMGIRSRTGMVQHIGNAKGKTGEWTEVVIDLGKTAACGMTIEKIMAAYDSRSGGGRIDVLFDDIALESSLPLSAWHATVKPAGGNYPHGTKLTIDNASGMTIRYTLDASNPTSSSPAYEGPITLPQGTYEFRYAFFDKNNELIPFIFSRSYNIK